MNRITDSQLTQATARVRYSMLMALDQTEIPAHNFSSEFELRIRALRKRENRRQSMYKVMRHCVAAILALVLGAGIFLTVNVEARATVIAWIKEVFEDRIEYWFIGVPQKEFPKYELTWLPDEMECIYDETTEFNRSVVYMNPNDPQQGFTFVYSQMQEGSGTLIVLNETEHSIIPVDINGMVGDLYLSQDPEITHCLIWFDEDQQITFNITSYMDADVILHIAESVKLLNTTK